jgi:cytochrome c-type biogenesis protein
VLYSLLFLAGFLAIFMGICASSSFGSFIAEYGQHFRATGSLVLALLGIYMFGKAGSTVFSQKGWALPNTGALAYPAALFIGIGIASGWTPCIGPTLGDILIRASTQGTASSGVLMLVLYSVGLAMPFLVVTLVTNVFINYIRNNSIAMTVARVVSGSLLTSVGYILATDSLRQLTKLFPDIISY